MPYLRVINEQDRSTSKTYPLTEENYIIGRSNSADIVIFGDGVSRQHAQIHKSGTSFMISDLKSRNGTYLNNQPIHDKVLLSFGDHIRIGQTILMYMDEATEPVLGSMLIGSEEAEFQGTLFKADQIANTMVGETTQAANPATRDHLLLLTQLSKDVMSIASEKALAETLTQRLLEWFKVECCSIVYPEAKDEGGYDLEILSISWSTAEPSREITISRTAVNQALENKMASITTNAMQDDRFMAQQSILARGITSILCVPLWHEEHIFGLIYMDTTDPIRQLDLDHLGLLSAIANLAAIKIDNLRMYADVIAKTEMDKELELAGQIQARLLPGESYDFNTISCVGYQQACLDVGGDYYDFIPFNNNTLTVTIADVTDHGPPSALLMVACKTMLTALIETGVSFDNRIEHLNRYLVKHSAPNQFITFFHAEIDLENRAMRYCNAGHNAPVLVPEQGELQLLLPKGPPLGIMELPYEVDQTVFDRKSKLVMYTDGITESSNPEGELYEEPRLLELITQNQSLSAGDLKQSILKSVELFSDGTVHLDDVTLSIVERID